MFLYKIQLFFYKMPLTPPSFLSRLSILILMILFSSVFLWADEEEEDTLEETEEEATGPLQIKQHFVLQIITSKAEQEIRKRIGKGKTSGSVKKSLSCLSANRKAPSKNLNGL